MKIRTYVLEISTGEGIDVRDITPQIRSRLEESGVRQGFVTVSSRHTTTALAISENEERLIQDIMAFLKRIVPSGLRYLHNDIHLRDCPPDEPENAHSHIMAMLLGSSECIPVADRELALGTWQSVMLFELDGPRARKVTMQIVGAD